MGWEGARVRVQERGESLCWCMFDFVCVYAHVCVCVCTRVYGHSSAVARIKLILFRL